MPSGIVFSLSLPAHMQIIVSAFLSNKSKLGFGFFSKLYCSEEGYDEYRK